MCPFAATGGHLAVLRWAREHHCPWGPATCVFAAMGGHLEVLQWAREHGFLWDKLVCQYVSGSGYYPETHQAWLGAGARTTDWLLPHKRTRLRRDVVR